MDKGNSTKGQTTIYKTYTTCLIEPDTIIFIMFETDSQVFLLKSVICHVLPLRYQKQNPNIKRNKCLYFQLFIPVLCLHPDCIFNLLFLQTRVLCGRPVFEREYSTLRSCSNFGILCLSWTVWWSNFAFDILEVKHDISHFSTERLASLFHVHRILISFSLIGKWKINVFFF
jgi:hypothetical protein